MPTLYSITVPVFIYKLKTLKYLLTVGASHFPTPVEQQTLIESRLIGDMGNLAFQIQRLSDTTKGFTVRLAGAEPVAMPDNEKTLEELQERIDKTLKVLEGVKEDSVNGKEGIKVTVKTGKGDVEFTGEDFVSKYAIPNFYFHYATAYGILRSKGVPIGKSDYMGVNNPK